MSQNKPPKTLNLSSAIRLGIIAANAAVVMPPYMPILWARKGLRLLEEGLEKITDWQEKHTWARFLVNAAGVDLTVTGLENVTQWDSPAIIVANHGSQIDILLLNGYLPRPVRFVSKKELKWIPLLGWSMIARDDVFIDRSRKKRAGRTLQAAISLIWKRRLLLVFFPEGTRTPDGEIKDFHKGAFLMAIQAGVPVIPVVLVDTDVFWPKESLRLTPGPIHMHVMKPFHTAGYTEEDTHSLMNDVREAMVREQARLRQDMRRENRPLHAVSDAA